MTKFSHSLDLKLPQVILIETASTCNRGCSFCYHSKIKPPTVFLPDELLSRIAESIPPWFNGRISFHGINEPTLDTRLGSIIRKFRSCLEQAYLSFNTNGDLLSRGMVEDFISAGIDRINFSVYDANNAIRFRTLVALFPEFIRRSPFVYENRAGFFKDNESFYGDRPCFRPLTGIQVKASGKIVLCCSDMKSHEILGDLREKSIIEIFSSEAYQRKAKEIAEKRSNNALCSKCNYTGQAYGLN